MDRNPDLLFDKANRNIPPETVFDSKYSVGFHYAFVATLIAFDALGRNVAGILVLLLAVGYFVTRRNLEKRSGEDVEVYRWSFLRHWNELLHRNFALLFCFYLTRFAAQGFLVLLCLVFGASIDSFREYRIARSGSGSSVDLALSRMESSIQQILIPAWWYLIATAVGLAFIMWADTIDSGARILQAIASAVAWVCWLSPEVAGLPQTLAQLGVPNKYNYVIAAFGFLNFCSLLYLFLACSTQQKQVAGWVRWKDFRKFGMAYALIVMPPLAILLYWFGIHHIQLGDADFPIVGTFGTAQTGDAFVCTMLLGAIISTTVVWLSFFTFGVFRRIYGEAGMAASGIELPAVGAAAPTAATQTAERVENGSDGGE